jgi:hypothetical protein
MSLANPNNIDHILGRPIGKGEGHDMTKAGNKEDIPKPHPHSKAEV